MDQSIPTASLTLDDLLSRLAANDPLDEAC